MSFEQELRRGIFAIPWCSVCSRVVWPAARYCSSCLGATVLQRGDHAGKIVEFSAKDGRYFGIIDFEGVRIMATILGDPEVGRTVRIARCGISKGGYFFEVC